MCAVEGLHRTGGRYAMAFICISVGQGVAQMLERVELPTDEILWRLSDLPS